MDRTHELCSRINTLTKDYDWYVCKTNEDIPCYSPDSQGDSSLKACLTWLSRQGLMCLGDLPPQTFEFAPSPYKRYSATIHVQDVLSSQVLNGCISEDSVAMFLSGGNNPSSNWRKERQDTITDKLSNLLMGKTVAFNTATVTPAKE